MSTAAMAMALAGGALTIATVTAVTNAVPAAAISSTPSWFTTGGTAASTLSCGTWYVTTLSTQTGGGSANITIIGGGGGGGGSSTGLGNEGNSGVGGAGARVIGTYTVTAGQTIAAFFGCGGGGGGAHSSGSAITGGTGGTGFSNGGNGGQQTTVGNQSGGGAGGGSSAVCIYGTAGSPCATVLSIAGGGGGSGAAGCTGNGGNGGNGNAGATTGTSATSEPNPSAPGGSAGGQGFGGGGGGSDSDKQAAGGGGGGGIGAVSGTASTTATTGGGGAANSTGGAGGAVLGSGSGPAGSTGAGPDASGNGAAGPTATADNNHQGGGGGGGGYYGGGSGAANGCTLLPALGSGGGGAGSSWVSTSHLTSFTNGSNPTFTAGSGTSNACGQSTAQGTSTSNETGAGGVSSTASGIANAWAGCPGNVSLTWTALPGAPSGVTATGGNAQSTVSWTAPADPGTSAITGYTVTATPTGAGSTVTQTFNSTATTETLTGLTNGDSYNLSVAAVSTVGTGPSTDASNNPIAIGTAPSITSADSTTFAEGSAGTFVVTTTGTPAPALSETGTLPSGVNFVDNGDGTAALSGTPDTGTQGSYPITIKASNGLNPDTSQSFTLTVDGPPSITSADSTIFTEGSAGSFAVTTTGTPAPALSETGTLPSGVNFVDNGDGTAALSGTPAVGTQGTYPITVGATNGQSPDASQSFTLTVDGPPAITSGDSTTFTEGSSGTFTVTSTGTPGATLSESGSLPSGVTFADDGDGTATLAGTPAGGTSATYPITITASNGVSPNASQSFTLTVDGPPAITSGDSTTFTEGSLGTFAVTTSGLPNPALSESGSLPSGITFTDNSDGTAALAGTPDTGTQGSYPITITASNGFNPDATQSFTLTVTGPPTITSGDSTTFTEGSVEDFTVTSTGTPTPALTEHGHLPAGITFTDNGDGTADLAGTPAAGSNGVYTLTIDAKNGVNPEASQTFTLTVNAAPVITSANSTTFDQNASSSFTVTTTGDPTPSLTEFGNLPSGITFHDNGNGTGTLSGTTSLLGTYQIFFRATNGVGPVVSQEFTLTVGGLRITTTSLPPLTLGTPYSVQLMETGGVAPIKWTKLATLPKGLTLSKSGLLAGTVLASKVHPGTYSIQVKVTDSTKKHHQTQSTTLSLQIQS